MSEARAVEGKWTESPIDAFEQATRFQFSSDHNLMVVY